MSSRGPQKFRGFHDDRERVRASMHDESLTETEPLKTPTVNASPDTHVPEMPTPDSAPITTPTVPVVPTAPAPPINPPSETAHTTKSAALPTLEPKADPKDNTAKHTTPPAPVEGEALPSLSTADGINAGTIIRDKKVQRATVWSALKNIFQSKKKTYRRKQAAKEAVRPKTTTAESRLDTLKAAAKQSHFAPENDYNNLLQRIKTRKQSGSDKEVLSNITIQSKAALPQPTWGSARAEESDAVTPEHTAVKTTSAAAVTPVPTAQLAPKKDLRTTSQPSTSAAPPPSVEKPRKKPTTNIPTSQPAQKQPSANVVPKNNKAKSAGTQKLTFVLRSASFFYVSIAVLVIAGGGLIGGSVWWWLQQGTGNPLTEEVVFVPQQSLLSAPTNTLTVSDRDTMFSTIYSNQLVTSDVQAYAFMSEAAVYAAPQDVITALEFRMNGSFYRSILDITAGNWRGTDPYIVLRGTTFDSTFAGLLEWERNMSSDLAPLFGEPVTNSFDPTARTSDQIRAAFFADDVVANTSVRILRDETGETRLLYGFVTPNTVIITTSESAYQNLLPLIIR